MSTISTTYNDIELSIDYEFEKGEPMVMYYNDGSGYPGSPDVVEIQSVFHKEIDIYDLLSKDIIEHLEQEILEIEQN